MDRRQFLTHTAGLVAGTFALRALAQTGPASPASPAAEPVAGTLTLDLASPGHRVPENYNGLSYELAQLSDPNFFAASNQQLIALFRQLSPLGVLRLGGNSSETCWLKVDSATDPPEIPKLASPADQNWMPQQLFPILPKAIDNLAEFIQATGWQLIYGLNFGHSSPERLAREAEYIAGKVGKNMLYFQIGNEPDFYASANNRTRPANWGFKDYIQEWLAAAQAILKKVPDANFGGPDVGSTSNWVTQFIPAASKELGKHLVAVSGHYYASGPPDDPRVTIARLLRTSPQVARSTKSITDLAAKNDLVYRMTEGNSCYRGGKPGMSDAFASALWAGDYMLTLAANRAGGVNLHGGSRSVLRAALGNHMPGEQVATAGSDTKGGYYTPIAGEVDQGFTARPIFYGMFLANQLAGCTFKPSTLTAPGVDATAYAAQKDRQLRIALFNKDPGKDLKLALAAPADAKAARLWRLTGPALDATTGTTLAGAPFSPVVSWKPAVSETPAVAAGQIVLTLPHNSGALLFLDL